MPLRGPTLRRKSEPTTTLINVVFLMLIFFLIAGQIAPPLDSRVELVETGELDPSAPPDAVVVLPDGTLVYRGVPTDVESVVLLASRAASQPGTSPAPGFLDGLPDLENAADTPIRLVPDRALPARDLMRIAAELEAAGAAGVLLVTERGLK